MSEKRNRPPSERPAPLLRRLAHLEDVSLRLRRAAELLLGRPYTVQPLIGGPDQTERPVFALDGFDCVTFVESALALARSRDTAGFRRELMALRYRGGRVAYDQRLHYFSDWLAANQRRGAIRLRTRGAGAERVEVELSLLAHFPARRVALDLVPKRQLQRAHRRLDDAAIVAFASTRKGLDFFHTGLLLAEGSGQVIAERCLIHASRRKGRVISEALGGFLHRNRMRGLAFATPLQPGAQI